MTEKSNIGNIKGINYSELIEIYAKQNNCFIIQIGYDGFIKDGSFDCDKWDSFMDNMKDLFDETQDLYNFFSSIILSGVIQAEMSTCYKVFDMMNEKYYNDIYCALIGPDGYISENT